MFEKCWTTSFRPTVTPGATTPWVNNYNNYILFLNSYFYSLLECGGNGGGNFSQVGCHQTVEQGIALLVSHPSNSVRNLKRLLKLNNFNQSPTPNQNQNHNRQRGVQVRLKLSALS